MRILSLLGAVAGLALVVAACGGGTEYQTADAVKAFNAYQDNAKYGIALACPEMVPADAEFDCTFSTKGGTPQKATFVIEKDKLELHHHLPETDQLHGDVLLHRRRWQGRHVQDPLCVLAGRTRRLVVGAD